MKDRSEFGFGEMFQTALRKGSDTKWSGLLWNLIYVICEQDDNLPKKDRVWRHFIAFCESRWHTGTKPSEAVRQWIEHFDDYQNPERLKRTNSANAFLIALELCDKETYDDIDATVHYWVEGE